MNDIDLLEYFNDKIIEIKSENDKLNNYEFKGSAILLLLLSKDISNEDLYIDYYDEKKYEIINKSEALNYIKNGKLDYITVAYSKHYIDEKTINDIKDYIINFNDLFSKDLSNIYKRLIFHHLYKIFISSVIDIKNNLFEIDDTDDEFDDIEEDDEDIELSYLYNMDEDIIDEELKQKAIDLLELYKIHKDKDDYELEDYLEDEEFIEDLIRVYYNNEFLDKKTLFLEPKNLICYNNSISMEDKYNKMLLDLYEILKDLNNDDKEKTKEDFINILNKKIRINYNFYSSYVNDIDNFDKFFDKLRFILITNYYNSKIINNSIDNEDDRTYINYIREDVVTDEMVITLFELEDEKFSNNVIDEFVNNNLDNVKKIPTNEDKVIIRKINPFK